MSDTISSRSTTHENKDGHSESKEAVSSSSSSSASPAQRYTLPMLLAAPKGNTVYTQGQVFLLHVFWETPNYDAAKQLIQALQGCAISTHRDTPCVPTYFFRISHADSTLYGSPPMYVRDHPQLMAAQKKLSVGVPRAAVCDSMKKTGLDPTWLDWSPDTILPIEQQQQTPVAVECTEIYLDERGFMEHAGSKDYLDSYGKVMNPALMRSPPHTVYMGTPTAYLAEKIIDPILKATYVCTKHEHQHVWKQPSSTDEKSTHSFFLSVDFAMSDTNKHPSCGCSHPIPISSSFSSHCTTLVTLPHAIRSSTTRLMAIMNNMPTHDMLDEISKLVPVRGEIYVHQTWNHHHNNNNNNNANNTTQTDKMIETLQQALNTVKLDMIYVHRDTPTSGYVLHNKVQQLTCQAQEHSTSTTTSSTA